MIFREKNQEGIMNISTTVWIDRKNLMASFHPVKGYEAVKQDDMIKFREVLQNLVDLGFRFQ